MLAYSDITAIIVELLHKHDCVIVPGFGGYVARQQPATFSASGTSLLPPTKSILFNRNLIHQDGLLASHVMEKMVLNFNGANQLIADYVNYCQSLIQAKNRLELKHLGLFYKDSENQLRFEPETDVNFLIHSFGLSPVVLHELSEENITTRPIQNIFEDRKVASEPVPVVRKKRSYAKIAALAVGVPAFVAMMLFVATSKPMKPILESSLNPFYSPEKNYIPTQYKSGYGLLKQEELKPLLADANGYGSFSLGSDHKLYMVNVSDTVAKLDKTFVHHTKLHVTKSSSFEGSYQVVVGCFGVKENAERLIHELQNHNFNAGISGINNKGLHIVSCGGFNKKEDAVVLLNSVRQSYPNAWVMAK